MSAGGVDARYNRSTLVEVLVYHYRKDSTSCGCGWAELGRSHPEHVADVYEMSAAVDAPCCAGRLAVRHERTPMLPDWCCPVCGEVNA